MIFLTPSQIREVDYLISQSKSGVHHLFRPEDIKIAFSRACNIDSEDVDQVKDLFYEFISQESIEAKKAFCKMLDQRQRTLIIRTYFNVVDNELSISQSFLI